MLKLSCSLLSIVLRVKNRVVFLGVVRASVAYLCDWVGDGSRGSLLLPSIKDCMSLAQKKIAIQSIVSTAWMSLCPSVKSKTHELNHWELGAV